MSLFLPISKEEMKSLGWKQADFILISGDAYIDHPSFAPAIIGRVLESAGYKVAILPQPNWEDKESFQALGEPRLSFLVCSGNMDSMVNHYTSMKKPRSIDAYSPGGKTGLRPNRALIVYCNTLRSIYGKKPIVIGGLEASLRRFCHYDYWQDSMRESILADTSADILIYGMGERQIVQIADMLNENIPINEITNVEGTLYKTQTPPKEENLVFLADASEVITNKRAYAKSYLEETLALDRSKNRTLAQKHKYFYVVQNPPAKPLDSKEMDKVYSLPFTRKPHPSYKEEIPAIKEVEFSLTVNRGCFGGCSFCAIGYHQGRAVTFRSQEGVINEAVELTKMDHFKGNIHDVGGPTADIFDFPCPKQKNGSACMDRRCLTPTPCKNFHADHSNYVNLLRGLRKIPKVKRVFIRSGIRYDYALLDKNKTFIKELCRYHVSGHLKIAPEHVDENVLTLMGKPNINMYNEFCTCFKSESKKIGKEQYILPYFISSHPGSDSKAAIALALFLKRNNLRIEQVQDFYPTPGSLSTVMYYTGLDPYTMEKVYTPKSQKEKTAQKALMQYYKPQNQKIIIEALKEAKREDLIGFSQNCLVRPLPQEKRQQTNTKTNFSRAKSNKKRR